MAEPRRGSVLVDAALLEPALSRAAAVGAVAVNAGVEKSFWQGTLFIEIRKGHLRLLGQGEETYVPLRSWAEDQVYGAYKVPSRMHQHGSPRGQYVLLKQLSDGTLLLGHWQCQPASSGTFWTARPR